MSKFATGKFAIGICARCGMRAKYSDLVEDGQYKNLRVHTACRDIKNPQEKPFNAEDGIALKHPAPDLDRANDPVWTGGPTLIDNLPPLTGGTFGGGT